MNYQKLIILLFFKKIIEKLVSNTLIINYGDININEILLGSKIKGLSMSLLKKITIKYTNMLLIFNHELYW